MMVKKVKETLEVVDGISTTANPSPQLSGNDCSLD